jgi:hypothetical protein
LEQVARVIEVVRLECCKVKVIIEAGKVKKNSMAPPGLPVYRKKKEKI